jgi:hypothetical protein
MHTTCTVHVILFDEIILVNIWWSVQIMNILIMQFSQASCYSDILD